MGMTILPPTGEALRAQHDELRQFRVDPDGVFLTTYWREHRGLPDYFACLTRIATGRRSLSPSV